MKDLQRQRQNSKLFAGKHGFITLRDLFRWAERRPRDLAQLAEDGYMLLAERLRYVTEEEEEEKEEEEEEKEEEEEEEEVRLTLIF
jgi:midasin